MSYDTRAQQWWATLSDRRRQWWRLQVVEHLLPTMLVIRAAEHVEAGRGWPRWAEAHAIEAAYDCHMRRHQEHPNCDPYRPERQSTSPQGAHDHDRSTPART